MQVHRLSTLQINPLIFRGKGSRQHGTSKLPATPALQITVSYQHMNPTLSLGLNAISAQIAIRCSH